MTETRTQYTHHVIRAMREGFAPLTLARFAALVATL